MCRDNTNQATNRSNPWPGLSSYKDPATITKVPFVFCGRDKEKNDLYNLVNSNILVTLYGKSGLGKTSLLNAGVFPLLRERQYFPINIRLGIVPDNKSLQKAIREAIETNLKNSGGDIVELSAVIKEYDLVFTEVSSTDYLWTYFASHKFIDSKGNDLTIVLAFDQFEEILYSRSNDALLLLQQILYMMNDNNNLPSFEEEGTIYNYNTNFRFILAIREDNLFMLEDVIDNNYLQAMKKNRYRLKEITLEGAKDVVKIPGQGCIDKKDEDVIIDRIVNEAQDDDGTISSLMISFLCNRLFAQVQDTGGVITLQQVEECGSETLEEFCRQQLSLLPDDEFDLFAKHLITEDGRRKIIDISTFSKDVPNGMFLLDEKTRLLHTFKISSNKERQVEIIHDKFSLIVLSIKTEISERKQTEQTLKMYELEQKRLLEEEEKQRISRNKEYNQRKRFASLNVLSNEGRSLIDNSMDFGEYQTIKLSAINNSADKFLLAQMLFRQISNGMFKETAFEEDKQEIFSDPLLSDVTYKISFKRNSDNKEICTSDGIYAVAVKYKNLHITDISFYGKDIKNGTINFESKLFIYGGFCSIHIDYDTKGREVRRTYLGDNQNPILCMDGYSIIETIYDTNDNPIKRRYYKTENGIKLPSAHLHGNYGFDSEYDDAGNEIYRFFVDEKGCRTPIVSGVYGKRIEYDPISFKVITITNLDEFGNAMEDIDGYVKVKYEYDEGGRVNKECYYDKNDNKWENPSKIYGTRTVFDLDSSSAILYNLNSIDEIINDKEGVGCIKMFFNNNHKLIGLVNLDKEGMPVNDSDGICEQQYDYDSISRINSIRFFDKDSHFLSGYKLDFNKEGTHVLRFWNINANGSGIINEYYGVNAVEIVSEDNEEHTNIKKFVNSNNQFLPCSDGYWAARIWDDSNGNTIKEVFLDEQGSPQCDNDGVWGHEFEYVENVIKQKNIDQNGKYIEDNNGVFCTETINEKDRESLFYFNIENAPVSKEEYHGIIVEEKLNEGGKIKITYLLDEKRNPIQIGNGWSSKEEYFDSKNRLIKCIFLNTVGEIVRDSDGDYIVKKSYPNDCTTITSIYDDVGEPCISNKGGYHRIVEIRDNRERLTHVVLQDLNNMPIQLEEGVYGYAYEYNDEEGTKKTIYLNEREEPISNGANIAYFIEKFDHRGRNIERSEFNLASELLSSFIREYVDSEERACAYYLHLLDSNRQIQLFPDGISYYRYIEEDSFGNIVKQFYLGKDYVPVCDSDGDYGESTNYDLDAHMKEVVFLDKDGNPHDNRKGYSSIKRWYDDDDNIIKELYFTVEGKPCMIGNESYGFIYDYLSNGAKITGFLDESGNVHNNDEGYAYKEELSLGDGSEEYYYDVNQHCVIPNSDKLGDYGKRKIQTEDGCYIISLDASGCPHINKKGYIARGVASKEDGTIILHNLDKDYQLVMDDYGDYATEVEILDGGLLRKETCLDKNFHPHNNLYGFSCSIKTTDYAGGEILLYYDNSKNQVLPRKSLKAYILDVKRFIKERLSKNSASQFAFNERQIGATNSVILVRQELGGLAKKHGLKGTFVLLELMDWNFYDDTNKLTEIIPLIKDSEKQLVLLPITLDGPNLLQIGDVISVNLPKGKLGFRFVEWNVNQQTYEIIRDKKNKQN